MSKRVDNLYTAHDQHASRLIIATAHELKTPLTLISNLASVIDEQNRRGDIDQNHIDRIEMSSGRLLRLIDSILLSGEINHNQGELELEPVCIPGVIEDVVHEINPLALAHNRKIEVTMHRSPYLAVANKDALFQVLYNMFDNAIKYSNSETTVKIETRNYQEKIRINVRDEGVGVGAKELKRMFRLFGRVRQPVSGYAGSSGLGLYISSQLVSSMDGQMGVHKLENGSCFFVSLPRSTQVRLL